MKLQYWAYELRFKHPFRISKGAKTHQPTLIVELEHRGLKGYGEAPAISYYGVSVDKMIGELEKKRRMVEQFALTEPDRYWHYLHHLFGSDSFLISALDMAAWDLLGKIKQKPLYKLWNLDIAQAPLTDYTIGIDSIDQMLAKMREKPWPVYKIKLGSGEDLAIIRALRSQTHALLRVDVNAGWSLSEALAIIAPLEKLGVELVEQPLAKDDWDGMKSLYANSSLPLIADESCVSETDVEKCGKCFHGINIKLTKCGGLTPALRMIKHARQLGLKVMVGSMNESTVGSAAIAHLLPLLDYVDMDGPLLLAEDVARGLNYEFGKVAIPSGPGLGIEFTGL
jgi:L-Ala-D/L-Glu epimerase